MDGQERRQYFNEMSLYVMEGTKPMPNYVFKYYVDHKVPPEQKQVFNLIADSFLSVYSVCHLMKLDLWSQASTILRMAIEQVSAVFLFAYQEGAIEKYTELYLERVKYAHMTEEERKEYRKSRSIKKNINEFFDYYWIKNFTEDSSCGRNQLLKVAKLDEFLPDIENTLNQFSHGSLTIFQFNYDNWNHMRQHGQRIYGICFKLFDFLACAYTKLVGEGVKLTPLHKPYCYFKTLYIDWLEKEGWLSNS